MGHASIETTQKFYADYQESSVLDRMFQMKNDQKIGTRPHDTSVGERNHSVRVHRNRRDHT